MLKDLLLAVDDSAKPVSLSIGSPELDSVRELADIKDYPALLSLAEDLSERGIYDVRLLIYGVYGEFISNKLLGLPDLYESITLIFTTAWHAIGPEQKRDTYAKNSLSWLFTQILIDFQTVQLDSGEEWNIWLSNLSHDDVEFLQSGLTSTVEIISESIGDIASSVDAKVRAISDWIIEFDHSIPEPIPETEDLDEPLTEGKGDVNTSAQSSENSFALSGSPHLKILLEKIQVFEHVLLNGDMLKAAVIANDINQIMESFDPRLYFPQLFSSYFYHLVGNINPITELMDMRDTPQWIALHNLYSVDIDRFKDMDIAL